MEERKRYTKKQLDELSLRLIKQDKDVETTINDKKYILDIKTYKKELRFYRPELFENEGTRRI